ncbi:hypothetical protein NDU88_007965 [Pleurodeles waltl]|uniref:Secreted protein n=1 Tax=Pleurodeles waltl TaxID=8319 RepID=A0AAV7RUQ0_PLEWA|nr:hypothetical protein NDU88_007965 [Pleurodeles waltl]
MMGRRNVARPLCRLVLTLPGITQFYRCGQRVPEDFRLQRRSQEDGARAIKIADGREAARQRYTEEQRGRMGRRKKTDSRRREVGRCGRNSGSPGGATRDYQPRFRRSVADSGASWDRLKGTRDVGKGEEGN